MSLETKPGSKWIYGRFTIEGERQLVNLGIEKRGCPPVPPDKFGDALYERTREKAQSKLSEIVRQARENGSGISILEKIHALKTGNSIVDIPLEDLADHYLTKVNRDKPLSIRWKKQITSVVLAFTIFCAGRKPPVRKMSRVSKALVDEFGLLENSLGNSPGTYNNRRGILHAIFEKLGPSVGIVENPFTHLWSPSPENQDHSLMRFLRFTVPAVPGFAAFQYDAIFG